MSGGGELNNETSYTATIEELSLPDNTVLEGIVIDVSGLVLQCQ